MTGEQKLSSRNFFQFTLFLKHFVWRGKKKFSCAKIIHNLLNLYKLALLLYL